MKQNSYKIEIITELLKEENHIRGLAKNLNINPMTISRKIRELSSENVVDYKKEGKNNKYFLKKTIEAKNYTLISENYKLNKIIRKYPSLRGIVEKIQKNNNIKLAILFGSYAKNTAKEDSDIDIYIETANLSIKKEIELFDARLSVKIGKYDKSNLLIKEIEKNHIIIKGTELYYEKNKIFD